MILVRYFKGIFGLGRSLFCLIFMLLLRPHYLLILIGIVLGVFYAFGIPPKQIPDWWHKEGSIALALRWDDFTYQLKKRTLPVKKGLEIVGQTSPITKAMHPSETLQNLPKESISPAVLFEGSGVVPAETKQKPVEELASTSIVFKENEDKEFELSRVSSRDRLDFLLEKTTRELQKKTMLQHQEPTPTIVGRAYVLGADTLKINDTKVRLDGFVFRSGQQPAAYRFMTKQFDGVALKCWLYEKVNDTFLGDCMFGKIDLVSELINFGFADER